MRFHDRVDAGRQLSEQLREIGDVVVLGLPRGGVPVAAVIARTLRMPLDVIVVRKLGVPAHPEVAMGAIGEDGARILDSETIRAAGVTAEQIEAVEARERVELERRVQRYRGGHPPLQLGGRTALIVDDGMATGSTAIAATQVARLHGASRVVVAVPVASPHAVQELRRHADAVVSVEVPTEFLAVGQWYEQFSATPDEEVVALVEASRSAPATPDAVVGDAEVVDPHHPPGQSQPTRRRSSWRAQ